jgi:aryl-alcohol dehydrogenase-like predicted oxidoreductase
MPARQNEGRIAGTNGRDGAVENVVRRARCRPRNAKARLASHSPLETFEIGAGTSAWGDTRAWRYGRVYRDADLKAAFDSSIASGVRLFDTAELYGLGRAESLLGRFIAEAGRPVSVATKFFPYPWRVTGSQLLAALRTSLARLGVPDVALYQIHWPLGPRSPASWMEPLAAAVREGLVKEVGVSNYSASQTRAAFERLAARGVRLASNQVEYSLVRRGVEFNGVVEACRDLNVRLIAYRPLASGVLSGKYTAHSPPPGVRRFRYRKRLLSDLEPLVGLLEDIGRANGNRTRNQVALNWLICQGALPIPGAVSAAQAAENAGAAGWRLRPSDVAALSEASATFASRHIGQRPNASA